MRELVIGALGLLLAVSPASAALIEVDLFTQGDKLLTLDTSTGLEWLDLTATEDESYNSIIGGFGGFITSEGFRYATEAEIAALWGQAGIVDLTGALVAVNRTGVELLLLLMGCTGNCGTGFDLYNGISAKSVIPGTHALSHIQLDDDGVTARAFLDPGSNFSDSDTSSEIGSYLVRTSVIPEPCTALLLGVRLLGLAIQQRRVAGRR
jgi:hypothetical protein